MNKGVVQQLAVNDTFIFTFDWLDVLCSKTMSFPSTFEDMNPYVPSRYSMPRKTVSTWLFLLLHVPIQSAKQQLSVRPLLSVSS